MWVENLKCMHYFRDLKTTYFYMDVIFNIKRVEIGCVTFVSTQHDLFIKRVKWVRSCEPTSLIGRVRVEEP